MATLVHSGRPDEELIIFWVGMALDQTRVPPDARIEAVNRCAGFESGEPVRVCKWHLPGGIRIGTTLKRLEALNGRPFSLYGFDWDDGGAVSDWKGGKLMPLEDGCRRVGITLAPPEQSAPAAGKRAQDYLATSGDRTLLSSLPAMQRINPRVSILGVRLATVESCATARAEGGASGTKPPRSFH